jgi:hypothetical protein
MGYTEEFSIMQTQSVRWCLKFVAEVFEASIVQVADGRQDKFFNSVCCANKQPICLAHD